MKSALPTTLFTVALFLLLPLSAEAAHERRLIQQYYIIHYDDDLRTPIWTAYHLEEDVVDNKLSRGECFRIDPRLSKEKLLNARRAGTNDANPHRR